MPKGVLLVLTRPTDEAVDDDYNHWYDEVHLSDVLTLAGYTAATRYRAVPRPPSDESPDPTEYWKYLALYEVEADDLQAAHANLLAAAAKGDLPLHDALEMDPAPVVRMFEQITDYRPSA